MRKLARNLGVGAIACAAFALGSVSAAYAASPLNLRTSTSNEGSFSGSWEWRPVGQQHGGFAVNGSVCDNANDGNGVYGQGRVDGTDWSSKRGDGNGSAAGCGSEGREFWNPPVSRVSSGQYQVCVDDVGSDTCGASTRFFR